MFAKSLILFASAGVVSGLIFGFYLIDAKSMNQPIYVEGASLSIVTEKSDFKAGEIIKIRLINSGTVPLEFSDTSYGLQVTGLSGITIYNFVGSQALVSLEPGGEVEHFWNQVKTDDDAVLEGIYKISAWAWHDQSNRVEGSTTVTIR